MWGQKVRYTFDKTRNTQTYKLLPNSEEFNESLKIKSFILYWLKYQSVTTNSETFNGFHVLHIPPIILQLLQEKGTILVHFKLNHACIQIRN